LLIGKAPELTMSLGLIADGPADLYCEVCDQGHAELWPLVVESARLYGQPIPEAWNGPGPALELGPDELAARGIVRADQVQMRKLHFFWKDRLPMGAVIAVPGDGGAGKSTLLQALGARMTRGQLDQLPGAVDAPAGPRGLVVLTTEESRDTVVVPRLTACGADLSRVRIYAGSTDAPPLTFPRDIAVLKAAVESVDAGMVVLDTGPSFLDPGLDGNQDKDVRRMLGSLAALASETGCVAPVVLHLNKGTGSVRQRVMGAAAWVNFPRVVLVLGPPPGEDARATLNRVLVGEKSNEGPTAEAVRLRLVPAQVAIPDEPEPATVMTIGWGALDASISSDVVITSQSAEERSETAQCAKAIRELLANGQLPAVEAEEALKTDGFSPKTIRTAREPIGVVRPDCVYQVGFQGPYYWRLP
jgi:hypothetical protein